MAATKHNNGGDCSCSSWILATILYNGIFYILLTLVIPWIVSIAYADEKPTACAVELAAFKGLPQPPSSSSSSSPAGPTTAATSPAFDLIVHVNNGGSNTLNHGGGGDVVVSYAGVPLAHGRTPALLLGGHDAVELPVQARSAAVGVPGDLFRLMAGERRWGVAQLQVEFGFALDSFVCNVQLDTQQRVFDCYSPTSAQHQ